MTRIADHLAQLPSLAARTAPAPRPRQTTTAGRIDPTRIVRPEPGPRLLPGLDLAAIDRSIKREHSLDQLAKLRQCIQTIYKKGGDLRWTWPELAAEDRVTWTTETDWLLATMDWWITDAWCSERITTEVEQIRATLIERIERASGWTRCALCGEEITTYSTETLDVAECPRCDRVISMREREALTVPEVAKRLGISEAAAQKRMERGHLRKVGRRGKQTLVAPPDGLDWAREKLGLSTGGVVA